MGNKNEAKTKTFLGVAVEMLEEVAKYMLKALLEKTKTVNKGKRAVVRSRTKYRMRRLASEVRKAKSNDIIKYTNVANREELAWRLGMPIKPVMNVRTFKRRVSRISKRRLLMAEKKLPGALLYLFGQKVVKSGKETSLRPMEYGHSLKKGDSFRLMLSWNRAAYLNIGLKKLLEAQEDVYEVKIQQLGSRGRNGIARRAKDGNFYYVKADGSKGRYANVYDSLITVHTLKIPKQQRLARLKPQKAPIARAPKQQTTVRARTASYLRRPQYKAGSLSTRRISHPKYSPGEGVKPLVYKSYFATLAEQKRFNSIIESIQEIKDPAKLAYLAKQIRESASDKEPIVKYMGKYARYGTMLIFALFKRDMELLGEKTNIRYTVTISSALRRLEHQGRIRARNEAPFRKKITESYMKKFKKKYPELTDDQIKEKLKEPAIKAKIEKEVSAIVSGIAAKKTASSHLSGSALDIRIVTNGVSLLSHNFVRNLAKGQTIYAYKRAWTYYNLIEDGAKAMTKYKVQLRAKYKAKYSHESAAKIEMRVKDRLKRDKSYYDMIRSYKKKNRYGHLTRPHWEMMVARRKVYKLTKIRKFYPTKGGELTSELWHKYVGKRVYKKPELARRTRPGTLVRTVAKKPASSPKFVPKSAPVIPISHQPVPVEQRRVEGYSVVLGEKDHVPKYIRRRRERMYKEVAAYKGDFDVQWYEKKEVNGGRPIYITKMGPNNGQFVPGLPVKVIIYKHGHGDPRGKMLALLKGKWNRGNGMEGMRNVAKRANVNIVMIAAQGDSSSSNWPELQSSKNFQRFVDTSLSVAGVSPGNVTDRYMIGHSGASYFMIHAVKNLPVGYLSALGLADTMYGEKVGDAYYSALRKILKKYRLKIFARYRYNTPKIDKKSGRKIYRYPWHNNNALKKSLLRAIRRGDFPYTDREKDILFHYCKTETHSQIKASVLRDALKFFVLGEKTGE